MRPVAAMAQAIDISIEHLLRARHLLDYHEQTAAPEHETVLIAHSVAMFNDMGIDALTDASLAPVDHQDGEETPGISCRRDDDNALVIPRHDDAPIADVDIDIAIWHRMRWRNRPQSGRWTVAG